MSEARQRADAVTRARPGRALRRGGRDANDRPHVLVVEDDRPVADTVRRYLDRSGFAVALAADGDSALRAVATQPVDVVVLDLGLPDIDGMDVLRLLRSLHDVAVIVLSARCEPSDRVAGLEAGADDYLIKPFSPRELAARITAVLRRLASSSDMEGVAVQLVSGSLVLDTAARTAALDGQPLALTATEFDLLAFLVQHAGTVFTREELLRQVWGYTTGDASTVTVHIHRLREKIEPDRAAPTRIATVWGKGYRFDA